MRGLIQFDSHYLAGDQWSLPAGVRALHGGFARSMLILLALYGVETWDLVGTHLAQLELVQEHAPNIVAIWHAWVVPVLLLICLSGLAEGLDHSDLDPANDGESGLARGGLTLLGIPLALLEIATFLATGALLWNSLVQAAGWPGKLVLDPLLDPLNIARLHSVVHVLAGWRLALLFAPWSAGVAFFLAPLLLALSLGAAALSFELMRVDIEPDTALRLPIALQVGEAMGSGLEPAEQLLRGAGVLHLGFFVVLFILGRVALGLFQSRTNALDRLLESNPNLGAMPVEGQYDSPDGHIHQFRTVDPESYEYFSGLDRG